MRTDVISYLHSQIPLFVITQTTLLYYFTFTLFSWLIWHLPAIIVSYYWDLISLCWTRKTMDMVAKRLQRGKGSNMWLRISTIRTALRVKNIQFWKMPILKMAQAWRSLLFNFIFQYCNVNRIYLTNSYLTVKNASEMTV